MVRSFFETLSTGNLERVHPLLHEDEAQGLMIGAPHHDLGHAMLLHRHCRMVASDRRIKLERR